MESKNVDEIPIWWRSDLSSVDSKGVSIDNKEKSEREHGSNQKRMSTRTLKKWFPDRKMERTLVDSDMNENRRYNHLTERLNLSKINNSAVTSLDGSDGSVLVNSKNVCKPCFSSLSENKEMHNKSVSSSSCSFKQPTIPSFTLPLPSSNLSFSPTSLSSSSSCSCSSSFCSSSSSSCTSCCLLSNSSTSFIDSLSSSSSYSRSFCLKENEKTKTDKNKINDSKDSNFASTISSVKKGILSIQKLPSVRNIPSNPYVYIDELSDAEKVCKPDDGRCCDRIEQKGENKELVREDHNMGNKEGKEEYLARIDKLENWDKLKQVMLDSSLINEHDNVLFSLFIYHIDLMASEYCDLKKDRVVKMFPRITISIKGESLSSQLFQHNLKTSFLFGENKYYWSKDKSDNSGKQTQSIQFIISKFQNENICNYFSITIEGIDPDEEHTVSITKPSSVFLGISFCPLPQKNDNWDVTLPIYSAKRNENSSCNGSESLIKFGYLPKDHVKVGLLGFKISRRNFKSQMLSVSDRQEDKKENSIENEKTSHLREIKERGLLKTIVSGEVNHDIHSAREDHCGDLLNIREKELELKEREIGLKEKELELKIKMLSTEGLGHKTKSCPDKVVLKKNEIFDTTNSKIQDHGTLHNHLFCQRRFNRYFKVNLRTRYLNAGRNSLGLSQISEKRRVESGSIVNSKTRVLTARKDSSNFSNKKSRKKRSVNKETRESTSDSRGLLLHPYIDARVTPVHIPILLNQQEASVAPQSFVKDETGKYLIYCNPASLGIHEKENQQGLQIGERVNGLRGGVSMVDITGGAISPLIIPRSNKCEFENRIETHVFSEHSNDKRVSALESVCCTNSGDNCKIITKFLRSGLNNVSIDHKIIRYESGRCSNLNCKNKEGKLCYSSCEYSNKEIDYWSICEYCQVMIFPTLYNLTEESPKFVEFFFDSPIPLYFPSRKLIWPTSLHFLLSQFTSDCGKVRNCKTHDELIKLTRSMRSSLNNDILPSMLKLIIAIKVFQHPCLQKLLLSFSERDFFMIKDYWLKNDYVLNIPSSSFNLSTANLGSLLQKTLKDLKTYIQKKQMCHQRHERG